MNKIRQLFNLGILKEVYFYDYGYVGAALGLHISGSLYRKALEYAKERKNKNEDFIRKISELYETTKNLLNEIVNEKLEDITDCNRCKNCKCNNIQ